MARTIVGSGQNIVTPINVDASGNPVTDSAGDPAGNVVGETKILDTTAWPSTLYTSGSATAADVNDNTVVYESADVSMYNHHAFSITTAPGAGAVEVFISLDGTNYEATPAQVISDALVVGAVIQSVNEMTAIGNYHFTRKVKKWKLQNKGATTGAATAIRYAHSVI